MTGRRSTRGVPLLAALLVAVGMMVWCAPPARALVPPSVANNADGITQWLYRGGAQDSSVTPRCLQVCDDLWLEEHRPMPNLPSSKSLFRELRVLRWKAGLRLGFRALGPIGLGVTAADLGWKIGTGIRGLFEDGETMPAKPPEYGPETATAVPRDKGEYFAGGSSLKWEVRVIAPRDGYHLIYSRAGSFAVGGWWSTPEWERDPNCIYRDFGPPPAIPAGFTEIVVGADAMGCASRGPEFHWYFKEAPAKPVVETIPPGNWPGTFNLGVQPESFNATRQKMLDEIGSHPQDYPTVVPWLRHHFGDAVPDPIFDVQVRPELCLGLPANQCKLRLEDLGFLDVQVHVLDFDHAATGIAGDRTVGLYSAGQAAVVPTFDPATVTIPEDYPVLPIGTIVPAPLPATLPAPTQTYVLPVDKTVTIISNPAVQDMPVRVLAPLPHETADAYRQRLQEKGLVGRVEVVPDSATDLDYGPNEVIRLSPQPGTRLRTGTEVLIEANPQSAPAPGPGPAGQCGLTPPASALDLSPITRAALGRKVPFSLLPFVGTTIGGLATPGAAPNVTFRVFGATADLSFLENFSDVIGLFRLIETILLWMGVAWFLYGRTIGKAG